MTSVRSLAGPGSLRAYGARLGESPGAAMSLRRLTSADLIARRWQQYGGMRVLGSAVSDVVLDGGRWTRRFSAGTLRVAAGAAELDQQLAYRATLTIPGYYCERRAKTDQKFGPSSEPYIIATVVDEQMVQGEVKSILSDVASDVNGGDFIGEQMVLWTGANPGQLLINIAMWEEDGGQGKEIRNKVETSINDAITLVSLKFPVIGAVRNLLGKTGDRIIRSMANTIKELFKDDTIGESTVTLAYPDFNDKIPPQKEWGDTGTRYRRAVKIDGGDAGVYHVLLNWSVEPIPVPKP